MKSYSYGTSYWKSIEEGNEREWMLSNGIGGYSGHTIIGGGNRLHHGYLIASRRPPVERVLAFTRTQESLTIGGRYYDLSSQKYMNWQKDGHKYLSKFTYDGLPTYRYQVEDFVMEKTIAMVYGKNTVVVCYEVENGCDDVALDLLPLFNYKEPGQSSDVSGLRFTQSIKGQILRLIPESDHSFPIEFYASHGDYKDRRQKPINMTTPNYIYEENHYYKYENDNGFTGVDTHYTPYDIALKIKAFEKKKFYVVCSVDPECVIESIDGFEVLDQARERQKKLERLVGTEDDFVKRLAVSGDHFIVDRASTGLKTILAGYPWFNDWGRDTMIALNGLTLCTRRYEDARDILGSFAKYVKNGLIPNNFPDGDKAPGYNTVDGSLWYFYAVDQYLEHTEDDTYVKEVIYPKLIEIIKAYYVGTDHSIAMDSDGLIVAGDGSLQLTWMDVKIGDWVVTPRNGKPVEVNALWYNALKVMEKLASRYDQCIEIDGINYKELANRVKESFRQKFWNEALECLYDVVDINDPRVRCNQIWAVSLPYTMLPRDQEAKVVAKVYKDLYTPFGLRSLGPREEGFVPIYIGKHYDRDASYHMGTTWAYPMGAFISAYCKVNDHSKTSVKKAQAMCFDFVDHMNDGCINGIAEIFDGDSPNKGRGCYNQAWSVSELLRAYREDVLPNV